MAEESEDIGLKNMKSINPNTQIVFSLKGFIATILSILGMFIGFHKMVIQPAIDKNNATVEKIQENTDKKFDAINNKLIEISNGLGVINGNIDGINNRFKDLNDVKSTNQGGGFQQNP
jgi:hypothetical protein